MGWDIVADGEAASALLPIPGSLLVACANGLRRLLPGGQLVRTVGLPDADPVTALGRVGEVAVVGTSRHGVFRSEDDGVTWAEANDGLPFRGRGLSVGGFASTRTATFAAHPLGVSRSDDAGRCWEVAGAGLPLRIRRLAVAASGPRVFAEADGRLFRLDGETWIGWETDSVALLGADHEALYGLDPDDRLVWRSPDGGAWMAYDDGLPSAPRVLVSAMAWKLAVLASGALWRRTATSRPSSSSPDSRLDHVAPFLTEPLLDVSVTLTKPAVALLSLIDEAGAEAVRLWEDPLSAGTHRLALRVGGVPAGLYRCRLTVGTHAVSRPLAVLPGRSLVSVGRA